jgi:hypothetical protein
MKEHEVEDQFPEPISNGTSWAVFSPELVSRATANGVESVIAIGRGFGQRIGPRTATVFIDGEDFEVSPTHMGRGWTSIVVKSKDNWLNLVVRDVTPLIETLSEAQRQQRNS